MTAVLDPAVSNRPDLRMAMQQAVARLDPATAAVAGYHLGWTEVDGSPCERAAGKEIRPRLAMLSAQLCGASAEVALPAAVAVELVHNFSLLHDDLMDGDTQRRHRPTVWSLWGSSTAILAGDALLGLATEVLLESSSPHAAAAARGLLRATRELIRGQVEDLAFEQRDQVDPEECQLMAAGKTGALLAASASLGAVLAGADEHSVETLHSYGAHLGAAFQFVDDLLGIWGDPAVTGKPVLADLRARKKSLPVSHALASDTPAGAELARWYRSSPGEHGDDEDVLQHAARLVEAAGGRDWAVATAAHHQRAAETVLLRCSFTPGPQRELLDLGRQLLGRTA